MRSLFVLREELSVACHAADHHFLPRREEPRRRHAGFLARPDTLPPAGWNRPAGAVINVFLADGFAAR